MVTFMKKAIPVIIALVLILIIGGVAFGGQVVERYSYSHEQADLYEYFHITKESDVPVILQNELAAQKAVRKDGVCYMDYRSVQEILNSRFYIDKKEGLLLYTTPTEIVRAAIDASSYTVNGVENTTDYCIFYASGSDDETEYYIALDYVKKYTNFSYEFFSDPGRIQIYTRWEEEQAADIKADTDVRTLGGVKSPVLCQVKAGDRVVVLDQMETWSRVKTADGFIGYVENKKLTNERAETPTPVTDYTEPEYTSLKEDRKICLGWHGIYGTAGNSTLSDVTANVSGMTVIAPTWFSVSDTNGSIRSYADASYVEKAHEKGLEVWGVVDDFNYVDDQGNRTDVAAVLASTTTRTALIDNIMNAAQACGMDGVNVDFEKVMDESAGEDFVEFLRELSIRCRQAGLVLSVDDAVPYHFNTRYNLKEQGVIADYVIVMAYDEHYAGSEEAGSVSSIDYVRYAIEKTGEYVPGEKIVVALPFYTRLWITEGTSLSSEAYPMTGVDAVLQKYNMTPEWDDATGQNYAEATDGTTLYQMWVEDLQSLNVKLTVMKNYELGGVAAWRLGFEPAGAWDLIKVYLWQ